jgi:hypothetical protein
MNNWASAQYACHICGKHVPEAERMPSYNIRCVNDLAECFKNRITTRIIMKKNLKPLKKYMPFEEQLNSVINSFRSTQMMQMADFVILVHENGGVEFIKDRYEDSRGKVFFAE